MRLSYTILGLLVIASLGCNSFSTTALDRRENDCLVVNPDCPMKGIPVTLRVPTHLELKVIETTYWEKQETPGQKATLVPLSTCRKTRTVEHEACFTEKVFLVDPKRPVAGTQNFGFTFRSNEDSDGPDAGKGKLSGVTYRVDDTTIEESANLISNALGLVSAFQTSSDPARANTGTLISTDRIVAYGRFDINASDFEQKVSCFLDTNVNHAAVQAHQPPQTCTIQ